MVTEPELMGQRVASGHIRIPNEVLTFIVEQPGGLVGARVVTFDSTGTNREEAIQAGKQAMAASAHR